MLIPESPNPQICTSTSNRQIAGKVQRATNQPKNNLDRPRPLLAPNLSQNLYHPPTDLNWTRNCQEKIATDKVSRNISSSSEGKVRMRIWRNISVPADLGHLLISNETRCLLWGFHSTLLTEPQQMTLVGSAWYHSQSGITTLKIISSLSNTHHHSQSGVIALKLISPRSHSYHHSQTHDNTLNKIHILQSVWQKDQT